MKILPEDLIKKNPFVLAPMDDVTDIAFRELCEKLGASYTISELTSVEALIRDKIYLERISRGNLKVNCVQLFGSNPDSFIEAIKKIEDDVDIIDINFGCPSPSVNSNNSGAILLEDPKNIGKILDKIVKYTNLPVTAKIRLGYKKITYLEVAKEIENCGVNLITVHGRTAEQKYSGKANWEAIKEIKEKLKIPVIGNGDITNEEDIDKYLGEYSSGLMIGRAAIGNPDIFNKFNYYNKTGNKLFIENLKERKKELFLDYIKLLEKYQFKNINLKIQKQAMWFTKGIKNSKDLRFKLSKINEISEIKDIIKKF